ncbi:TolB family protein [Streptomyces sp. NPDC058656]|uniref:TolB family protein n=1 Tax=unclassified Streptomyces TaxID=2593676 RepID=UPI003649B2FA
MIFSRTLAPGQSCHVMTADIDTGDVRLVHTSTDVLLEAPNWAVDDRLILNGDGVLWQLDSTGGSEPTPIPIDGVPELNNDHVLAPDGTTVYLSANDGHLYAAPLVGGTARRVTPDHGRRPHFLHGVSPDGRRLAYIGWDPDGDAGRQTPGVYTTAVDGTDDRRLTHDLAPADGSEYSPDGEWIYFNTERFSTEPGHAQIARMRVDGTEVEQLTFDQRVNWFPHLAPDGGSAVYLSFPPGTVGHPADLVVELRVVRDGDWAAARSIRELSGGQGTINVNSWAPDGRRFAFVEYPFCPFVDDTQRMSA